MAETGMMADIAAVTDNNKGYYPMPYPMFGGYGNNGFGMDGSWVWVILLFALFGGWGGGFGGGFGGNITTDSGLIGYALGNNATKGDLTGVQTANKLDNISTQIGGGFANNATQLCSGFADVQSSICNGTNTINTGLLSGFANSNLTAAQNTASIVSAIDNSRFAQQQCCCDIKTAIANSDNLAFRNTCDIENMIQAQTTAIKEDGEKTRSLIIADKIEQLERDLAQRDRELQTARFDASQVAQTASIVNQLQPVARPAYLTCSPYMSQMYANGFGNPYGCNCGSQFIG